MAERTQEEILARFTEANGTDWLGFRTDVLSEHMTYETLTATGAFEMDKISEADWEPVTNTERAARSYLDFAIGKIEDHRGISAERSVAKLREYAWLMGRDDVVEAMDAEGYPQYGAPQVRAFAKTLGWPWPDDEMADRMANGNPCRPDCEDGCGL